MEREECRGCEYLVVDDLDELPIFICKVEHLHIEEVEICPAPNQS